MNLPGKNISGYAWVVVALLWPVAMLNYLDRQMVSSIRASIRADIPSIANDQDFGTLPFAISADLRINRDLVAQAEVSGGKYIVQ